MLDRLADYIGRTVLTLAFVFVVTWLWAAFARDRERFGNWCFGIWLRRPRKCLVCGMRARLGNYPSGRKACWSCIRRWHDKQIEAASIIEWKESPGICESCWRSGRVGTNDKGKTVCAPCFEEDLAKATRAASHAERFS